MQLHQPPPCFPALPVPAPGPDLCSCLPAPQVCNQAPDTVYGTIIQDKINHDLDLAQAVGRIVYTTQAIVEKAADQVGGGGGLWARGWGTAAAWGTRLEVLGMKRQMWKA